MFMLVRMGLLGMLNSDRRHMLGIGIGIGAGVWKGGNMEGGRILCISLGLFD